MTPRQRIEAALRHQEPDRTPVFEYVLLSPIADQLLGRPYGGDPAHWPDLLRERDQGDAHARLLAEEVTTSYGEDLEAFVEKRFGERWSVRLTGTNLLDASKDEVFHKFDTLGDQIDRDHDEYELESEVAGPVYQMVVRYAF